MDEQNTQQQTPQVASQTQTFQVKVDENGGASIDGSTGQNDYRNNPDYVPDDPTSDESAAKENDEQPDKEAEPKTEADIQKQFDANADDVQTAAQFLESKGVSYEKVVAEYAEHGRLSDESYAKLKEAGLPRSMIDSYCAGQEALYAMWVNHVQGIAGGEKQYGELMKYASQNMSDHEKDAYDAAVNSGDFARAKNAVQALMYQYEKANPRDGYVNEGGDMGHSDPVQGFATPEEAYAAQEDPRMTYDPTYVRLFNQRLLKTSFLKD